MPIILTAIELANCLDITVAKVHQLARKGKIPSIRNSRGHVVFNLDAVIEALREQREAVAYAG